ncbi:SIS domain-containing protein [Mumia sp. zg.B53]|uniref:MurR/RpiR family transcriptional regulator n=1 Tax=unclassified Mumia TaxID=2621872 RepID=UPI001C6E69F0|nr:MULTISPECIES: SIS domain-containing protein [unclassified Mumia]MBW9205302.1 SIS domain-containing protein [Mumia sp. zg.B17]MBW9208699.1 SIS domain-containing protein [Mumia sp. zg.B21]MBW9213310.1 SIS domain-containing protein [Mumia sp. zg.B53]MDD9348550.1 SIS domain-containing protein [Mumia sp.]
MSDGTPARPQRRSAALLKRRLVDEQRTQLDAMLDWILTDPTLEEMAAQIVGARRRFVIGATQSFSYASLLALDLSASLANVHLVDGTIIRPIDVLSDVRSSDAMVAFSVQRYRKYTIDIAAAFRDAGGRLLVITDSPDAPLAQLGADVVLVPPPGVSFGQSPSSLSLVISVIASLTAASAKGAGRRSAQRDHLGEVLDLYIE